MKQYVLVMLLIFVLYTPSFAQTNDGVIYYEDFSAYADGELPPSWIGGDNLAVVELKRKKVLKDFVNGSYDVTTQKIDFPESFSLTIQMKHSFHNKYLEYRSKESGNHEYYEREQQKAMIVDLGGYQVWLGNGDLRAGVKDRWPDWQENELVKPGKTFALTIRKEGIIFSVFINDAKVLVGRYRNVKVNNIRFASQSKFEIEMIKVEKL